LTNIHTKDAIICKPDAESNNTHQHPSIASTNKSQQHPSTPINSQQHPTTPNNTHQHQHPTTLNTKIHICTDEKPLKGVVHKKSKHQQQCNCIIC